MGGFWNYEGSMKGSGVDAQYWTGVMYCVDCEQDQTVEGQTDDWGNNAYADCPVCGTDLELDISPDEDDYKYDNWKDRQLED